MGKYGEIAIRAVALLQVEECADPSKAWDKAAAEVFTESVSSRKKGCPKNAFLGLCEEGRVKGVPAGTYTRSTKNKLYAVRAIEILQNQPELALDLKRLWEMVVQGNQIRHNQQMNVVVSLWNAGLIEKR
ncbi:MAG: hypothetical protein H0Z39_11580 [Peptococcaceae bacterium]|nr:hypothetical protein [Peptococcaceae bacterium]